METQKFIFIKRRIEVDDYLKNFIFFNINYRRNVWNAFVEKIYDCEYNYKKFNQKEARLELRELMDDKIKETSNYYAADVFKQTNDDLFDTLQSLKKKIAKEHKPHKIRFRKFDRYSGSFKVPSRNRSGKKGNKQGKIHLKNNKTFEFRACSKDVKNHFNITLKEPLFDEEINGFYCIYDKYDRNLHCYFQHDDIKEIVFMYEFGNFYIALSINATYINKKKDIKNRKKLAGIDLGIHNPITLYDGEKTYTFRMSDKELNKIHYLERRCRRLQQIMDMKMEINKKRHKQDESYNIYTNSYERVRRKFRRTWKRIQDIRCNWRRKIAKFITTHFQTIVVDEMRQPTKEAHVGMSINVRIRINNFNRFHAMSLFTRCLKHDCEKFGCNFVTAEPNTTKTCCLCGYENPKLPLSKRFLQCENCGEKIDRDMNAAINCYEFYKKQHKK